jgi:SAM-dependent methyltransferase
VINYVHVASVHTLTGPLVTVRSLFGERPPTSLLDVGCGIGTWMRAARDLGVVEVLGLDDADFEAGRKIAAKRAASLLVEPHLIVHHDLRTPFNLGRKFDIAFCLEVGEHFGEEYASTLVQSICAHSNRIVFSAACPGQGGQNHINCQWPSYWQELFNREGFRCDDQFRWQIWTDSNIEPWYRQNIFTAIKEPATAGNEPRIRAVIHPEMLAMLDLLDRVQVEDAAMPLAWYCKIFFEALPKKLFRRRARRTAAS